MLETRVPIDVQPGIIPVPDNTELAATRWVDGSRVRWVNGRLATIGGWMKVLFNASSASSAISGVPRLLYSFVKNDNRWFLVGTNTRLYSFFNGSLANITPLVAGTTAIANSLATHYTTLGSNPLTTFNGSTFVQVAHTAHPFRNGDSLTFSGVPGAVNGIPAANLNATFTIHDVFANSYAITTAVAATSAGTGGGSSVVEKSALVTVTQTAHGFLEGDRVKILAATATGGIPTGEINAEQTIRNIATNSYDFMAVTKATSSVSAAGGASTTVQGQIAGGYYDSTPGYGYGMGFFGAGFYGVGKNATLSSSQTIPRLWSADRFGNYVVMTPGVQAGVYTWTVDNAVAPTLATNAPAAVNYTFVSDNFVVVLGPGGVENKVQWCDQGDFTTWSPSVTNQARSVTLFDMGKLISHVNVGGTNLVFSKNGIYTMVFAPGTNYVFDFRKLNTSDGLIAQNARCEYEGIAYWMGNGSFYSYNGGIVSELGSPESFDFNTVKRYVFARLSTNQRDKIFCGVNRDYNEIWWFYPSSTSSNINGFNEIDSYVIHNVHEGWWSIGALERTAIEYPSKIDAYQYMLNSGGNLYTHENGVDDDGSPLNAFAETNYVMAGDGDQYVEITGLSPDTTQTGTLDATLTTKRYPNDASSRVFGPYSLAANAQRKTLRAYGRQRKWRFGVSTTGSSFQLGKIVEFLKQGGRR